MVAQTLGKSRSFHNSDTALAIVFHRHLANDALNDVHTLANASSPIACSLITTTSL